MKLINNLGNDHLIDLFSSLKERKKKSLLYMCFATIEFDK